MREETWNRLKQIFAEALARPVAERKEFLADACPDDGVLRAEVEQLLRAHDAASEEATEEAGVRGPVEEIGTLIGRYRLLQQIGEGGFGSVYMAEQQEPVRRMVALKIIKLGMDTRQIIARFEAERQALAMMEHPNIARVLDAGAMESGRPYFVMELVKGISITEYCDTENLTTRERLALFSDVCSAVQHAHQKGIIHRDIKPSNVMVTLHDGRPVPKVIDFGIAKATQQRLTEKTLYTEYGQFIGTPVYMSPEQAEMSGLDIDTRSDIYSLGVLLYELLTGTTPFDPKALQGAAYSEIQRVIREEEPPTPSTRLDSLGDDVLSELARNRRSEPKSLSRLIRGDLDWIVMKALEKNRTRRYETVSDLAADISRHFNNEAVIARPPNTAYRLGRFIRKHRGPVATVAATGMTVVLLGALSLWQGLRAQEEANRVRAQSILTSAAAAEDPLLKAQLILEVADLPNLPGRLRVAREAANSALPAAVFRGHEGELRSVAFSPDGTHIVTASEDGTARIWRADGTGDPIVLGGHEYVVSSAAFSPDGTRILTVSRSTARVWPVVGTGKPVVLRGHGGPVEGAVFSPDGTRVLTTSRDGTARVWWANGRGEPTVLDIQSENDMKRMLREGFLSGTSAIWSPDGTRVLTSVSTTGTVRVWAADGSGDPLVLDGHEDWVVNGAFSPDGSSIVTASRDRTARVWRVDGSGSPIVLRHPEAVTGASFSPDGSLVLTMSQDGLARLWRVDSTGEAILLLPWSANPGGSPWPSGHGALFSPDGSLVVTYGTGEAARVWRADGSGMTMAVHPRGSSSRPAFSPDGKHLVTASLDTGWVWRMDSIGEARILRHDDAVKSARFNRSGSQVVTASADATVRVWPLDGSGAPVVLRSHDDKVRTASFSPDGTRVVTASMDGTARVWRMDDPGTPLILGGHEAVVDSAVFSPDGTQVATTSGDGTLRVWRADGQAPPVIQNLDRVAEPWTAPPWWWSYNVNRVAFSPDGTRMVTGSANGGVRIWPADGSGELALLHKHETAVLVVAFSPDGTRVISTSGDNVVRLSRADATGATVVLHGHLDTVNDVAFSPDSSRVATASDDLTVRIWPSDGSANPITLRGHAEDVVTVAFSPDGQRVVSGDLAGVVHVWRSDGVGEPLVLRGHDSHHAVNSVLFSPDGSRVLSASDDGTARLWRVTWPDLRDYLRDSIKTCLTPEQRTWFLAEVSSDAAAANARCERRLRLGTEGDS